MGTSGWLLEHLAAALLDGGLSSSCAAGLMKLRLTLGRAKLRNGSPEVSSFVGRR